jgi:cell division protein FtsN
VTGEDDYLDDDFYEGDDEPRFSRKKWIGGVLALLIVGGFGVGIWYAYDQGVKKGVQLAPPIISADASPVKVSPEDPGGMDIPNQDKQVFNVLQSGEAPEKVEKLMPPPEDAIKDEPTEPTETAEVSDAEKAKDESKLDTLIEKATKDAPTAEAAEPKVAEKAEESETAPEPVKTPEVVVEKAAPKVEEKKIEVAAAPTPKTVEEPKTNGPLYRVQVGSFRSPDAAKKQWTSLSGKYKSLLSGLSYRVQDVDVKDKGTYYRLQLGAYGSRDSANKLCSDLKAQKQDCLVVSG